MGQFSLTHWIILLMILVPTVALPIVPSWRIARKAGFSGAWCLLLLVPGLNVLAIWAFAFTRWPNSQDGNDRTSVGAMVWGALLLAMMVLGVVLMPMLEKQQTQLEMQTTTPNKSSASEAGRQRANSVDAQGKPCTQITEFLGECRRSFTYEEAIGTPAN